MFLFRNRLQFWFANLKDFQHKFRQRKYREILGLNENNTPLEIKEKYVQLLRKYHPDRNLDLDPKVKKENQEICKMIISAYDILNKEGRTQKTEQKPKSQKKREPKNQEQRIFYNIFGFLYEDDPYRYYKPENEHLRTRYEKQLWKYRATQKASENKQQKRQKEREEVRRPPPPPPPPPQTKQQLSPGILYGAVAAAIFVALFIFRTSKEQSKLKPQVKKAEVKPQQKRVNPNFFPQTPPPKPKQQPKIVYIDKNKQFQSYLKEQPPTLKYEPLRNYSLGQQLCDLSPFLDLQFYQVVPRVFSDCQYYRFKELKPKQLLEIKKIKPWTLVTLALQAQRCLQNVFIKRSYLLQQLKQHGQFKPPGICFRFYGYIFFRVRPGMPFNLSNVKPSEQWISLFDLYFKYYSPIPIRFNQYNFYSFPMRQAPQSSVSGNIHFNHRRIPVVYMEGDEKNVFFWKPTGNSRASKKRDQIFYERIWNKYYSQNYYS